MKKIILVFLTVIGFSGFALAAEKDQKALDFVQEGIERMMTDVVTAKIPRSEKEKRFDRFFRDYADLETIGKFALGRYWQTFSSADMKKFIDAFSENVVVTWERRFEEYSGQRFEFTGTHPSSSGTDVFVNSQMVGGDTDPVKIVWRVRDSGGQLKLVDIVIEGVSMLQTYRNEYAGILSRNNGDVSVIINKLKANTEAARKAR